MKCAGKLQRREEERRRKADGADMRERKDDSAENSDSTLKHTLALSGTAGARWRSLALVGTESAACRANCFTMFHDSLSGTENECHVESAFIQQLQPFNITSSYSQFSPVTVNLHILLSHFTSSRGVYCCSSSGLCLCLTLCSFKRLILTRCHPNVTIV